MVPLYVTSLFTSISKELAEEIIKRHMEQTTLKDRNEITTDGMMQICNICLQIYFSFVGKIYANQRNANGFTGDSCDC